MGVSKMTKEHLGISLALDIPFFIIVTKIDMAPAEVLKNTIQTLCRILNGIKKTSEIMKADSDLGKFASIFKTGTVCPIFSISSVTDEGIPQLKKFLSMLESRVGSNPMFRTIKDPAEFLIDEVFTVTGVGVVVNGTMLSGEVSLNQILLLGPDNLGDFAPVVVKSIHYKREFVENASVGESVCFGIRYQSTKKDPLKKSSLRRGLTLVDTADYPRATWEFHS